MIAALATLNEQKTVHEKEEKTLKKKKEK